MNRVFTLLKKELKTYFNSPIAYIVITVLLVSIGYFFFQTFFLGGQAVLRSFFRFAAWTFVLFGPAITMKLFAEEKNTGTIEPLLTLPVKDWEIVYGKFLAAWTLLAVYLLITLAYPITVSYFGDLDMGPVIGGYVGLFLIGGIFVAMGVFASTITRNQVVSLILAVTLSMFLFILDILLPFIPEALQSVVEFIGVDSHFRNIGRGIIDTRDVIYCLTFIALFLFVSVQIIQARLKDRSAKWRVNRMLYIGSAFGCFVALNILSFQLYGRVDLTQDKMYTLTKSSRNLVAGLDDHLQVKAYFSNNLPAPFNNHARFLRDELEEYRNYSKGHLSFDFVDPDKTGADGSPDPKIMADINAAKIPKVEVNKIEKDQAQAVKVYMGVALFYQDKVESIPILQRVDDLEYEISSRIAKMTREKTPKVAFLTGHGEIGIASGAQRAAQSLGDKFEVADLDLTQQGADLGSVDILVVAGPKKEIPKNQLVKIDQFVMDGGKAAFMIDANDLDMRSFIGYPLKTGLEELAAAYGVEIKPAMVLDQLNQQVAMTRMQGNIRFQTYTPFPPFIRVRDLAKDNPLVKNLRDLTIPFAAPLDIKDNASVEAAVVAKSSPQSWLFENEESFLFEPNILPTPTEDDFVGPQNLIVTLDGYFESAFGDKAPVKGDDLEAELSKKSPQTRLAVISSSAWIGDQMNNRLGYVFFANLMDWLAQDERLIGIRTRTIMNRPLENTTETAKMIAKFGNMIGLPLLFVLAGVVKWRLRMRKKRTLKV